MENLKFRISHAEDDSDAEEIHAMLRAFNRQSREAVQELPLKLYYEDEEGKKLAGLVGEFFGNWLCIEYLFVSEELRGKGIGRQLVETAETEARNHGCQFAFVDTFDFQAPLFYEKLGYKEEFVLREYPYSGSRHYYTKKL